jgi:diguanylate cyclase (GGDEF)-like protein
MWMRLKLKKLFKYKSAVFQAVVVGALLSAVFFVFAMFEFDRIEKEETIEATEKFIVFNNQFDTLVHNNINLLKGFVAFIMTSETSEEERIYDFLEVLLKPQRALINNVGIAKDTTIIWNYPLEPNKSTIGVDLAELPEQGAFVRSVKSSGHAVFQGPVNLIQGGRGFIIRYPIMDLNNDYWGQASIVLREDAFKNAIKLFEEDLDIRSIIIKSNEIIYGDEALLSEKVFWFNFSDTLFVWDVGIVLNGFNQDRGYFAWGLIVIGMFAFGIAASATYASIRANDIVKHESMHDQLTGLRNRNSLDETMEQVMAASKRNKVKSGILLIDLNKFKEINDTFGHSVGDDVLKETAQRLKEAARADEVLFRLGGDEFLLVIPVVSDRETMANISARLHESLTYRLEVHGNSIIVTASMGYAVYDDDGADFDTLFQHADKQMYIEKSLKPR